MADRPLTVLFLPESAYGPTGNCIGIVLEFFLRPGACLHIHVCINRLCNLTKQNIQVLASC